MKFGKILCEKLKEIRLEVARANGIPYEPAECHYEGECSGTCPRCEAEVKYLERQLDLKRVMGKAAFIGVAAGVTMAVESCDFRTENDIQLMGDPTPIEYDSTYMDSADVCPDNTIDMPVDVK